MAVQALAGTSTGVATASAALVLLRLSGAFSTVAGLTQASVAGDLRRVGVPTRLLQIREAARVELDPNGFTGIGA